MMSRVPGLKEEVLDALENMKQEKDAEELKADEKIDIKNMERMPCASCGAEVCPKCGECLTAHNEDPVNNCPGQKGNPSISKCAAEEGKL